jgi:hypothetical protein
MSILQIKKTAIFYPSYDHNYIGMFLLLNVHVLLEQYVWLDPKCHVCSCHHLMYVSRHKLWLYKKSFLKSLGQFDCSLVIQSQTCIKRSPLGQRKNGLIIRHCILQDKTIRKVFWMLCLTAWAIRWRNYDDLGLNHAPFFYHQLNDVRYIHTM